MKTNTINNEQVKNVNDCELSENDLEQVSGGVNGAWVVAGATAVYGGVQIAALGTAAGFTAVPAWVVGGACIVGGATVMCIGMILD